MNVFSSILLLTSLLWSSSAIKVPFDVLLETEKLLQELKNDQQENLFIRGPVEQMLIGPIAPGMTYFENNTIEMPLNEPSMFDLSLHQRIMHLTVQTKPVVMNSDVRIDWLEIRGTWTSTAEIQTIQAQHMLEVSCDDDMIYNPIIMTHDTNVKHISYPSLTLKAVDSASQPIRNRIPIIQIKRCHRPTSSWQVTSKLQSLLRII